MPAKIIFTADDYGCADAIDKGILYAVDNELINSVAAFPNGPRWKERLEELSKRQYKIDIGCHLTITSGPPVSDREKDKGRFSKNGLFREFHAMKREGTLSSNERDKVKKDLRIEIEAQLERLEEAGIKNIKHLSSHHNALTFFPEYLETVMEVARDRNLRVRSPIIKPAHKNKLFFMQLQARSVDNLDLLDVSKLSRFSKHMARWMKKYEKLFEGKFPKTPDYIDGRHYGPMPFFNVRPGSIARKAVKKARKLHKAIEKLSDSDEVEYVFHLITHEIRKYPAQFIDDYEQSEYHGVSKAYFDSRIVEMLSLTELKKKNFPTLSSWDDIN